MDVVSSTIILLNDTPKVIATPLIPSLPWMFTVLSFGTAWHWLKIIPMNHTSPHSSMIERRIWPLLPPIFAAFNWEFHRTPRGQIFQPHLALQTADSLRSARWRRSCARIGCWSLPMTWRNGWPIGSTRRTPVGHGGLGRNRQEVNEVLLKLANPVFHKEIPNLLLRTKQCEG